MRWLTRSALLGVALAGAQLQQAHASCTGGPGNGVPDANALTLFITSDVTQGDITSFGGLYRDNSPAVHGGSTGITAADAVCTYFATSPAAINPVYSVQIPGHTSQPYFNQDHNAGTVQFLALISTDTTNAIDRVLSKGLGNINVVNSARDYTHSGYCLASSINDLFTGSDGTGYAIDADQLLDEDANPPSPGTAVYTGTGLTATATGSGTTATAAVPGGRFQAPGSNVVSTSTGFCYGVPAPNTYGLSAAAWQTTAGTAATGTVPATNTADQKNVWLNDITGTSNLGTQGCTQGFSLYCLSGQPLDPAPLPTTAPPTSTGHGDPQFTGLQGQSFQVHGMPDEFFNLVTTPSFQLNSRFAYLASGTCNYNNTECWTHPGTYVDQLGLLFPGIQIKAVAGPHHKGLRAWVNGEEVSAHTKFRLITNTNTNTNSTNSTAEDNNSSTITVRHPHHDTLIVTSSLFTVEITNSDWFFNFNLMFHVPEILRAGRYMHYIEDSRPNMGAVDTRYPAYPMHGLVGQTWKNARYPAKRYYQGEVDDYMLLDHTLFSSQFLFNLYQY